MSGREVGAGGPSLSRVRGQCRAADGVSLGSLHRDPEGEHCDGRARGHQSSRHQQHGAVAGQERPERVVPVPKRSVAPRRADSTVPITVMPSRPATSRAALKTPDATPARATGIAPTTIAVSGTDSPLPTPIRTKLGMSAR